MSALRGLLELLRISWKEDPGRLGTALILMLLQAAALPLSAGALHRLTESVVAANTSDAVVAGFVVAALVIASLTAGHFAHFFYYELGDRVMLRLQCEMIELSNGSSGLEHHERPDYADKVQLLRQELSRTGSGMLDAVVRSLGLAVSMLITGVLLSALNAWLLLLPLAAMPALMLGRRAAVLLAASRESAAQSGRRARHLLLLSTEASAAQELRVCGLAEEIRRRQALAWSESSKLLWRGDKGAAALGIAGQLAFGIAYVCATLFVIWEALAGRGGVGDVIMAITLAAQVNQQVATAVFRHQELQGIAKTLADVRWIRELVARQAIATPAAEPPVTIRHGIAFNNVSFAYPATDTPILEGIDLHLPAGSSVALVGENGAGKSTLVKLLCRFYEVGQGAIEVDGVDIRRFRSTAWRERIAAGFQDFAKLEFSAQEAIGVGHLPDIQSAPAVRGAMSRARSDDLLNQLAEGLATRVGKSLEGGTELSHGQWQKLALGRAMMREEPLLLVLDEPTSALESTALKAIASPLAPSICSSSNTQRTPSGWVNARVRSPCSFRTGFRPCEWLIGLSSCPARAWRRWARTTS